VLDRIEAAAERRDPVIADLARQLRNRYYDQPLIAERARRPTRRWRRTCARWRTATMTAAATAHRRRRRARSCSRRC
jgi:hypothetical protein